MNTARRREINQQRGQTLLPELWAELEPVLDDLEESGHFPFIVQAYRSPEEQDALYAQGRETLETVNSIRARLGLDPILKDENHIVTNARANASFHQSRRACDIISYPDGSSAQWSDMAFYKLLWSHLEVRGWRWGGNFKRPDNDHFEK